LRKDGEYPLFDGIGSERTVTGADQSVSASLTYEAFGQTVASSGSSSNPYRFAGAWGYRSDGDAGLMLVGARYYDAQVGRFISRDTYLDQHPYLYCNHDPVNAVDPSGHWPSWLKHLPGWLKGGLAGAVVGGLVVIGSAIAVPAVGATVIGAIAIGGLAGGLAGIAVVGYGSDPGDVTWGKIEEGFVGGAVGGALTGPITGMAPMPWLARIIQKITLR